MTSLEHPTPLSELPPPQPLPEVTTSGTHRARRIVAGSLAASAAIMATAIGGERLIANHERKLEAEERSRVLQVGNYKLPYTGQLTPAQEKGDLRRVDEDFRRALSVDTCDIRVTPEETLDMYKRMFGAESKPADDPRILTADTKEAIDTYFEAADKLHFGAFPKAEFNRLETDNDDGTPELPVKDYREPLVEYLDSLGVELLDEWDPAAPGAPDPKKIVPSTDERTSYMDRDMMLAIMGGLRYMPQELFETAGVERIVLGDIYGNNALGVAPLRGKDIYIDTGMFTNDQPGEIQYQGTVTDFTATHEVKHKLSFACWPIINGAAKGGYRDNALRSLGRGAQYADDVSDQKNAGFTVLDSADPGAVVATEPYGLKNNLEDDATMGEILMDGRRSRDAFRQPGEPERDLTPIQEKMALLLARLNKQNPKLANFYVSMMQLGRIRSHVEMLTSPLNNQIDAFYVKHEDEIDDGSLSKSEWDKHDKLWERIEPYDEILVLLDDAVRYGGIRPKK